MSKIVVDTDSLVEASQRHGGVQNLVDKLSSVANPQENLSIDLPTAETSSAVAPPASGGIPSAMIDQIVAERVTALMDSQQNS